MPNRNIAIPVTEPLFIFILTYFSTQDERLKAAVKILGRNWTSISNSCFKQRSALSLSNRSVKHLSRCSIRSFTPRSRATQG